MNELYGEVIRDLQGLPERIRDKIEPEPNSGCWLWTGVMRGGYPQIWADGKSRLGHRLVYRLAGYELTKGLTIDHLCKTKCCLNPVHFELVTMQENIRRHHARTHCKRGHLLCAENIRIKPRGVSFRVRCLECDRMEDTLGWRRRKEARTGIPVKPRKDYGKGVVP